MKKIDTAVLNHLFSSGSVALLMHENPDWDCLGSCLALREALRGRGRICDIFSSEPLPPRLAPSGEGVRVYAAGDFDSYDCLCCVDVGDPGRVGKMSGGLTAHNDTACIDHHVGDAAFADLKYIDSDAPATAEIVFDMLKSFGVAINKKVAEYLYCALSSDTGSFKYSGTTPHTMRVAAELMELGADSAALCEMLYGRRSLKEVYLQGEAISALRILGGGKIGISFITGEVYEKYSATKNDTEGLSAFPREIDGVVMSAFLTQRAPGEIRVSLRSEGDYDIRVVAALFGGGGHMHAAGCTLKTSDMEAAVAMVAAEMEKLL